MFDLRPATGLLENRICCTFASDPTTVFPVDTCTFRSGSVLASSSVVLSDSRQASGLTESRMGALRVLAEWKWDDGD